MQHQSCPLWRFQMLVSLQTTMHVGSYHSFNLRFPQPAAQNPYLHDSPFYIRQSPPPHPRHKFSFHFSPSNQSHAWPTPVTYLPQREIMNPQESLQWHSGFSPHPYDIVVLQTSVKRCYGCGSEFAEHNLKKKKKIGMVNSCTVMISQTPTTILHHYTSNEKIFWVTCKWGLLLFQNGCLFCCK